MGGMRVAGVGVVALVLSSVGVARAQVDDVRGFGRFSVDAPVMAGSRISGTDESEIPGHGQRLVLGLGASAGAGFDVRWFRLEGRLEAGALFEPLGHTQPYFLPSVEPSLVLRLEGGLAVSLGASVGVGITRLLYGLEDYFVAGMALGGFAGFEVEASPGLRVQGRFGLGAWSADGLTGPPMNPLADGPFPPRGWALRPSLAVALLVS